MTKNRESRENMRYSVLFLLLGLGLIAAGIIGIITSRADSREYKNSTDIRKIPAVIIDFSTSNSKDDSGDVKYTTYKFKV